MTAFLSAAPILVAIVLLSTRRLGGHVIALITLAVSVVLAVTHFHFPWSQLGASYREVSGTALEIAVILAGGCLLNRVLTTAGTYAAVAEWLRSARWAGDRPGMVLLVVLGITPFAESVTGFGVGIVVAIPLLLNLGFSARRSATMGLLGLVIVPWGALAPGTLVAATVSGIPVDRIGEVSALLSLPVFVLCGLSALLVGCGRHIASRAVDLAVVAGALYAGVVAAQFFVGTASAGALGSLVGIAASLALLRIRHGGQALRCCAPFS
ncbi:L-lactate permease [Nocardia takedensis]